MINGHTYSSNLSYSSEGDTYAGSGIFHSRTRVSDEMSKRMRLLGSSASIQFLITVTAGYWLKGAVNHSGRVYKFTEMPAEQFPIAVSGVHMNGSETSLTVKTALADCVSTEGSFYFDSANRTLYVHPPTPSTRTIFDDTYQAKITFYFSRKPKNLRGVHWDGRLLNAPNLSLRIDARFTGVGQIGGGTLTLANADHFFDDLDESVQWDAGVVTMEIGVDYPDGSSDMDESDYKTVSTWRVEKAARSGDNFTLGLREPKTTLENKIPRRTFSKSEFPNIADDVEGKPIPWAWGTLFGVAPICIDRAARKFKLADHPIRSIEGIRVRDSDGAGGWQTVNFETRNLARAEFTLSAADWSDNQEVSVDFLGRRNADGSLMQNPADIMQDLLDYCGERKLDSESFNLSRAQYRVGTNRFGDEVTALAPCIYLDSHRTGLEVASEINSIAGSFLFVGHDGLWRYGAFRPVRASDLDPMAGTVIQQFTDRDIIRDRFTKEVDSSKLASRIIVEYAPRKAEDWTQRTVVEIAREGFIHALSPQFTETKKVGLGNKKDADYWGQRYLTTEAQPMVKYSFVIPWLGFFLLPGDKLKVEHPRHGLNHVVEILECHYNFNSPPNVRFVIGNNRGWNDTFGFPEVKTPNPPTLLDMVLWLRPENHIYAHGETVSIWRDSSGASNHGETESGPFTETIENIPHPIQFLDHVSGNHAAVDFYRTANGVHWFGFSNLTAQIQEAGSCEAFIVFKPDTIAPTGSEKANAVWTFGAMSTQVPSDAGTISEGMGLATTVDGISGANIIDGINLYNASRTDGSLIVRVNGNEEYNDDPGAAVAFGGGPEGMTIGGMDLLETYFSGLVHEVVVYKRVLSSAERADVVQYLSDKYSLGISAASSANVWDNTWTDAEVADARQNRGYVHDPDSEMADNADRRSFHAGRVGF